MSFKEKQLRYPKNIGGIEHESLKSIAQRSNHAAILLIYYRAISRTRKIAKATCLAINIDLIRQLVICQEV